jgi:hypothetical protein
MIRSSWARRAVPLAAVVSALALLPACSDDDGTKPSGKAWGRLAQYSGCKSGDGKIAAPSGSDCLLYTYDGKSLLRVKHSDAAFNCCPSAISADITVEGGTIRIKEKETLPEGPCRCLCLYDVDYEIHELSSGPYRIEVAELYIQEGDEPLSFAIDLASAPADTLCVSRSHYPWQGGTDPGGTFIGATGCKTGPRAVAATSMTLDCARWDWDGSWVLHLTHVNAAANCCADSLGGVVTVIADTIRIIEYGNGLCNCECLYDLSYEIHGLAPGSTYRMEIVEPHVPEGDDPLSFTFALGPAGSDTACVERHGYPWGP